MSYEKVKIITPEEVRNPETSYVYVGYGYSSTFDYTGIWIKEANGAITIVSGGTGGGGVSGTSYWAKSGSDLSTGTAFGISLVKTSGAKLYVDPAGTGTATNLQQLTVEGALKLGTTAPLGDYAGSVKFTGSDFFGYVTGRGWLSLTQSGGTSGTAGTSYWTPLTYGIAPDGYDKIYVGGSFSDATTDEPINSYGGITLGKKSGKPNKEGTIYYSTQGYFIGVSGTSLTDRRLDTWNVNMNGYAYYNDTVVVGRVTTAAETIGVNVPKLNVSGYTISSHFVPRYFASPGFGNGGFGAYSGSTSSLKYGLTNSYVVAGSADYGRDYLVDIVNGIIVNVGDSGTSGWAGIDYVTQNFSPRSGVFNVDTSNDKATSSDTFIVATNNNLTVDTSDVLTGKTMIVINTKAGPISISAAKPSEAAKSATLSQGKLGILSFDGAQWAMAEITYSAKTFS